MNAKQTVERMAAELTNAGYKLHSMEVSNTQLTYGFVTPENQSIFQKSEVFYIAASLNEYTNRWNAFFSYSSWGLFQDSINKSKMNYRQMWEQIQNSIKMEAPFFAKVGA